MFRGGTQSHSTVIHLYTYKNKSTHTHGTCTDERGGRERDRVRDREGETESERQTEKETDRVSQRQRERDTQRGERSGASNRIRAISEGCLPV